MPEIKQIAEGNSLADFIGRLEPLVQDWCRFSFAVAREIANAETVLDSTDFRELCSHFGIDYSTGRKLVAVGNSDRIRENEGLQALPWPTQYEVTLLNDDQFKRFKVERLSEGIRPKLPRADVKQYRIKNGACAKRPETVVVIDLDLNLIDYEDVDKVKEEINILIERLSPFPAVHITTKGLIQRLPLKTLWGLNVERAVREARNQLCEVVAREIAKMPGPDRQAQWLASTGHSWEELFGPKVNPNTVLQEKFGEQPVKPHLVDIYFARYEDSGATVQAAETQEASDDDTSSSSRSTTRDQSYDHAGAQSIGAAKRRRRNN